jgi:hypothetical protein
MSQSFSTHSEAERRIAELGKAGLLKPVHLPGRRWLLTVNRERVISRSQLFHVLCVEYEKRGSRRTAAEMQRLTNELWASIKPKSRRRK